MESVDKLREYARIHLLNSDDRMVNQLADAIEAEVAERYMELPLDADGVPIRPGDELVEVSTGKRVDGVHVYGVSDSYVYIFEIGTNTAYGIYGKLPKSFRHYHKPTVEDLLRELVVQSQCVADEVGERELVERFVPRLREAMAE